MISAIYGEIAHSCKEYLIICIPSTLGSGGENAGWPTGLPDCMNKLAKLLTMLFVFHCICLLFSLFF